MPKSYGRNERVAAAILRNARVYISFLTDNEEEISQAMEGLKSATGFLRSQIASRLNMRYTPTLDLRFDSLITESMKLDALIRKGLHQDSSS